MIRENFPLEKSVQLRKIALVAKRSLCLFLDDSQKKNKGPVKIFMTFHLFSGRELNANILHELKLELAFFLQPFPLFVNIIVEFI